ncbi:peptidase [Mucilaginibacter sp. PPCGB 2223]|uniref:M14 family metallopeptidase n=1 Tax=Mucilaginibacter sp. PPCGB 2223 TaxID=1886027 RepID=UPI0008253100|nr:M14 metallopeptidase family protein [Mucilaginibacter sp. PPCGB 2223]OCX51846.1 peptidase [Mucilaginibacter sp. PPCGB 2223]
MKRNLYLALVFFFCSIASIAQTIPSPKQHFGFNIGDDYHLANYTQTEAYFKKLAASPRTKYVDIGLTEEGRHQFMLIVSSPENIKKLAFYKDISQKLTRAENLTDAEAHKLAGMGKAVVWIDGGLHASETVGAHQLIQTAYDFVTRTDAETMNILNHDIILFVHANPDGQELVSNWYMHEKDTAKRNMNTPRLWAKYIGHDNNRDFYMMNMKESQNITREQYLDWLPQIVYNHHQAGPAGSVVAGPPFRDPFNYVFDPLLVTSLDAVGSAMNSRLNKEGKPGYTQRSGTEFSTWWNGGLRTATYFHNMVGLLTEIIGNPTPMNIPLVPERLIPNSATPFPVTPQKWHFKQSIDYSVSLNYAVLNYAARYGDELLYNAYQMGKNSIQRGSMDYWTLSPKRVDQINAAYKESLGAADTANRRANRGGAVTIGGGAGRGFGGVPLKFYDAVLKNPDLRDPRGYIITADQPDFATAVRFINTCIRSGLIVQKATSAFTVAGIAYPAGSYIIKTNQAFRPEVLDRFEPQDHPNDFLYPGGPPIRPYDMTGWTLAYQMGVKFERILDDFTGPFARIPYGQLQAMPAAPAPVMAQNGYLISGQANNTFIAVNDLFKAGAEISRLTAADQGMPAGTFYVAYSDKAKAVLAQDAAAFGVKAIAAAQKPAGLLPLSAARIALWDTYGGSMPSGWVRWLMEQYHFSYKLVYPQELDAGDLKSKYDVIVFVGGAIPGVENGRRGGGFGGGGAGGAGGFGRQGDIPAEFSTWTGRITADKTIPKLKEFLEAGGSIITIGSSANLVYQLNLPVHNALVDKVDGKEVPFSGDKFYVPGAVLRVSVDNTQSATWGMNTEADVLYDNSPAFKLDADAALKGIKPLMWFSTDKPLRSGWAFGQKYLKDDVTAFWATIGKGNLYVFGPEITFRGQAHGTFKLLFNELYEKP